MPVTCVYKHVDEVTRRTVEHVTEVVHSDDNINSDDQLSSVEDVPEVVNSDDNIISDEQLSSVGDSVKDVTEVVDSDSHLSEEDIVAENISKNDKPVNIFKTVKKLFMKSGRRKTF